MGSHNLHLLLDSLCQDEEVHLHIAYLDMGSYTLHLLLDSLCQDAVGKVHLLHTWIWDPTASISLLTASARMQ